MEEEYEKNDNLINQRMPGINGANIILLSKKTRVEGVLIVGCAIFYGKSENPM